MKQRYDDPSVTKNKMLRQHMIPSAIGCLKNVWHPGFWSVLKQRAKHFLGKPLDLPINTHDGYVIHSKCGFVYYWDMFIEQSLDHPYLARHICGNHPTIIDVGANEGWFSHRMFKFNPFAKVHAFEVQWAIGKFSESLEYCKSRYGMNYVPYKFGVGAKPSHLNLHLQANGNSSTFYKDAFTCDGNAVVPVVPLDNYNFTDVTLLKIDVDGGEVDVLRGAAKTLKRTKLVLAEIVWEENLAECIKILNGWEYTKLDSVDYLFTNPNPQ